MADSNLVLNRDLMPNDVPDYPVLQLEPPGGGHGYAWSRIWRFALTFDPHAYTASTGTTLSLPELTRKMIDFALDLRRGVRRALRAAGSPQLALLAG